MSLIDTIPHLSKAAAHGRGRARSWMKPRGAASRAISRAGRWTLLSLWAEQGAVHMALFDEKAGEGAVVSLRVPP